MMAGKANGTAKKAQITVLESRVESLELRNSHSIKQQPITAWRQSMGKMKRSGLFFWWRHRQKNTEPPVGKLTCRVGQVSYVTVKLVFLVINPFFRTTGLARAMTPPAARPLSQLWWDKWP